ncbi:hypothetical protein V6N13_058872 [Hibiscus sabdariffa]|uniref:RNase H type-1 domain-containing protein n=1 Tax=Hibiscus sabdariffa TaxID=183260 RepID=A0ABR2GF98_9ROSI
MRVETSRYGLHMRFEWVKLLNRGIKFGGSLPSTGDYKGRRCSGRRLEAEGIRALETAVVAGIAGTTKQLLPHKWEAPPNECLKVNTDGARDVLNG